MVKNRQLKIALVAGETSGDILGAGLISALKSQVPNIRFFGIAGPLMQEAGCESWYEMEELTVIGIVETISRLRRLLHIRTDLSRRIAKLRPDVFIGIDAPDFNITLEGNLKKQGIKTIHYVSPSIWAWRQKRILKIGKYTNLVLVFFPFEKVFYEKFNIPCRFIGHATADIMPLDPDKNAARDTLGIPHEAYCLALLPGSRETEIEMLSAIFIKTAKIIRQIYPNLEVIVPLVNKKLRRQFEYIKDNVAPNFQLRLIDGKSREVMIASNAALLASGTASLECMLAKCPMIVSYRMKPLTFWLAKLLVKTNYISLPNLLSGQELVREFLQNNCKPQVLAKVLLPLIEAREINSEMRKIFRNLHQQIRLNANEKASAAILELAKW